MWDAVTTCMFRSSTQTLFVLCFCGVRLRHVSSTPLCCFKQEPKNLSVWLRLRPRSYFFRWSAQSTSPSLVPEAFNRHRLELQEQAGGAGRVFCGRARRPGVLQLHARFPGGSTRIPSPAAVPVATLHSAPDSIRVPVPSPVPAAATPSTRKSVLFLPSPGSVPTSACFPAPRATLRRQLAR